MKIGGALIYRPNSRWLIWFAFICAIVLHVTAIALAENKPRFVPPVFPSGDEVIGIIDPMPQPQEPEVVTPPEPDSPRADENEFSEENATPRPIRPRKKLPITPVARSTGVGSSNAMQHGSVKALTMFAPRPAYPYEARRERITGSGVAELRLNPEVGNVIDARMAMSTGSLILDNSTLEALRMWRFKPGTAPNVRVPITFTLTGVSY